MIRNRIKTVIYLLVLILLCIFYDSKIFMIALIASTVIIVISLLLPIYYARKISVDVRFDKNMISKNQKASVVLSAINRSFFPIVNMYVEVRVFNNFFDKYEDYYINMPISINGKRETKLDVTSIYCGNINAYIEDISVYDPLGLRLCNVRTEKKNCSLMIMPELVNLAHTTQTFRGGGGDFDINPESGEDISEIKDIRQYIAGDRIQRIHWKLSVKQDELMVKEHPKVYDKEIYVLIELTDCNESPAKARIMDAVIDTVFTVSYSLLEDDNKFRLVWFNCETDSLMEVYIENESDILEAMNQLYLSHPYDGIKAIPCFENEHDKSNMKILYITDANNADKTKAISYVSDKVVLMCI